MNRTDGVMYFLSLCIIAFAIHNVSATSIRPAPNPQDKMICDENEVFTSCGSACPKTCENLNQNNKYCITLCVKGCFCKVGLVRNKEGKCVPPSECPVQPQCKDTEVYKECGTACPRTCEKPQPQICTQQCVKGCFCKDGLFRDNKGDCVPFPQCPNNCGKNETYAYCAAGCPTDYCPESNNEPPQCDPPVDCQPGCVCKAGYLKNNLEEETCILEEECPPPVICGENEHFNDCGTACPPTCDEPNPKICTEQCVRGCFCNADLVRNKNGECVPKEECPSKSTCPVNEEYKECGSACPRTCSNKHLLLKCMTVCVPGCFCKSGFMRNSEGVCVPSDQCKPRLPLPRPNPRLIPIPTTKPTTLY